MRRAERSGAHGPEGLPGLRDGERAEGDAVRGVRRATEEGPPRRSDRADGRGGFASALLDLFPGFTSGRTTVWAGVMLLVAIVVALHGYGYMRQHVAPAAIVAGIVALAFYCTGLLWLLYGYVCVPLEAVVSFDGKRWLALIGLALLPVVLVALLLPAGW